MTRASPKTFLVKVVYKLEILKMFLQVFVFLLLLPGLIENAKKLEEKGIRA